MYATSLADSAISSSPESASSSTVSLHIPPAKEVWPSYPQDDRATFDEHKLPWSLASLMYPREPISLSPLAATTQKAAHTAHHPPPARDVRASCSTSPSLFSVPSLVNTTPGRLQSRSTQSTLLETPQTESVRASYFGQVVTSPTSSTSRVRSIDEPDALWMSRGKGGRRTQNLNVVRKVHSALARIVDSDIPVEITASSPPSPTASDIIESICAGDVWYDCYEGPEELFEDKSASAETPEVQGFKFTAVADTFPKKEFIQSTLDEGRALRARIEQEWFSPISTESEKTSKRNKKSKKSKKPESGWVSKMKRKMGIPSTLMEWFFKLDEMGGDG